MKRQLKGKVKAIDIFAFIQGHIIYYLYHSFLNSLIPKYISEQIKVRISSMRIDCYLSGNCISCGCKTTQLQMSSKTCDNICYPKFLSRRNWKKLKDGKKIFSSGYIWSLENDLFVKHELENLEEL